jgi:hypothetical protein
MSRGRKISVFVERNDKAVPSGPKIPCDGCGLFDKELKLCAACGTVSYCSSACQSASWAEHKATCKLKKKEKSERDKAREDAARAKGSMLKSLMPPQPPQRYHETDVFNACLRDHPDLLQKMMLQRDPGKNIP